MVVIVLMWLAFGDIHGNCRPYFWWWIFGYATSTATICVAIRFGWLRCMNGWTRFEYEWTEVRLDYSWNSVMEMQGLWFASDHLKSMICRYFRSQRLVIPSYINCKLERKSLWVGLVLGSETISRFMHKVFPMIFLLNILVYFHILLFI